MNKQTKVSLKDAVNRVIADRKERKQDPSSPEEVKTKKASSENKREFAEIVRKYLSVMKGEQLSAQSPPKSRDSQPKKYTETTI